MIGQVVTAESVGGHSLAGSSSRRSQASSANRQRGGHSLAGSSHHSQASVAGSLPSPLRPPRPHRGTDIGGGDHQSVQSSPQIGSQLRRSTRFRRGTSGRPLDNEFVSG